VLILLFGDRNGNLQVALTTRSMKLRTHAGDVALPGGNLSERFAGGKLIGGRKSREG